MNYQRNHIDEIAEAALDTGAELTEGSEELDIYQALDGQMDTWQDKGYRLVNHIAHHSSDSHSRRLAREALTAFGKAEEYETLEEEHVCQAGVCIHQATEHNHRVIAVAETHRGPQRNAWTLEDAYAGLREMGYIEGAAG